jgi:hypothetical protein
MMMGFQPQALEREKAHPNWAKMICFHLPDSVKFTDFVSSLKEFQSTVCLDEVVTHSLLGLCLLNVTYVHAQCEIIRRDHLFHQKHVQFHLNASRNRHYILN